MDKTLIIGNNQYYYFDTYEDKQEAYDEGRHYKKKYKAKYYVQQIISGWLFPEEKYRLYLTKVIKLW